MTSGRYDSEVRPALEAKAQAERTIHELLGEVAADYDRMRMERERFRQLLLLLAREGRRFVAGELAPEAFERELAAAIAEAEGR